MIEPVMGSAGSDNCNAASTTWVTNTTKSCRDRACVVSTRDIKHFAAVFTVPYGTALGGGRDGGCLLEYFVGSLVQHIDPQV